MAVMGLSAIHAPEGIRNKVKEANVDPQHVDKLILKLRDLPTRGKPSYADVQALAATFSLDLVADLFDLTKPIFLPIFKELGAPSEVIGVLEKAQIRPDKVAELNDALPGMLERGYPTYPDLVAMAAALGLDLVRDLLRPFLLAALKVGGAPPRLLTTMDQATLGESVLLNEALPEMLKRRYPIYSDLELLAGAFGLEIGRDLLLPLIAAALDVVGAPPVVVTAVENAGMNPIVQDKLRIIFDGASESVANAAPGVASQALKTNVSAVGSIRISQPTLPRGLLSRGGVPSYSDIETVMDIFGLDPVSLLKPLVLTAATGLNFPPRTVSALRGAEVQAQDMDQLIAALPSVVQRRYPLYTDLELLAAAFAMEPVRDFLAPMLAVALGKLGAPKAVVTKMERAEPEQTQLEALKVSFTGMLNRSYPLYVDLEVISAAFGLVLNDDIIIPLVRAVIVKVASEEQAAQLHTVKPSGAELEQLKVAMPGMLQRGYPEYSDVMLIAEAFGVDPFNMFLRPLVTAALTAVGAPRQVITTINEAPEPQPEDVSAMRASLDTLVQRGYPTYAELATIASAFGLQPDYDLLKPFLITALELAGAPDALVSAVKTTDLSADERQQLQDMLPAVVERG
eukprot:TRINITY_DN26235_c0_g2_i1.p1 TRINITY_DN26235_c0_g2~~TRINITY_DN26235_c0_g2_i1.p1  ORF type:complete len:685 (+),score=128.24 TRINITY_DN26235_c0_g2_i1:179-2056(+)